MTFPNLRDASPSLQAVNHFQADIEIGSLIFFSKASKLAADSKIESDLLNKGRDDDP